MSNVTTAPSQENVYIGQGLYMAMFKQLNEYAVGDLFSRQTMCELAAELAISAAYVAYAPSAAEIAAKGFGSQAKLILTPIEQQREEIIQVIQGQNVYAVFPNGPRG